METKVTKKATVSNIPNAEADFINVARSVAAKWKTTTNLSLMWTTAAKFEATVDAFEDSFSARAHAKGQRSIATANLRKVNSEINAAAQYVKNYLADEYGKAAAPSHYTSFGIAKVNKAYVLPVDNDNRLQALKQLTNAVGTSTFATKKYGKDFWQDILTRFDAAKAVAAATDSTSSQHVGAKREQRPIIRQTLNSLVLLLKANYPSSWREELRAWGFQKEKY